MVEFALVLPLLLIVLFIIVDFGVAFSRWIVITNATREGARSGAVGRSLADVVNKTVETSNGILTAGNVDAAYMDAGGNGYPADGGDSVIVKTEYDYQLITPLGAFLSGLGFDSLTLSSCSSMRLELGVMGASGGGTGC